MASTSIQTRTPWQRFRSMPIWVQGLGWVILPPIIVALWAMSQPQQGRAPAWALVALVTGAWVSLASFAPPSSDGIARESVETEASTTRSGSSTATAKPGDTAPVTTAPGPTTTTIMVPSTRAPAPVQSPAALLDQFTVAPESNTGTYRRDLFGGDWVDADNDGCDTRAEVLVAESTTPAQVDPIGCTVLAGDWISLYDGYETSDPNELEIDHVVALAEAWRSGAAGWDPQRRIAYANDLDEPLALVAVTAATNQAKSDRDPSSWQPPSDVAWCDFATAWITVKVRWGLTADQAEVDALRNMLTSCQRSMAS
jgi:Protein of unknown function (DUF1524)